MIRIYPTELPKSLWCSPILKKRQSLVGLRGPEDENSFDCNCTPLWSCICTFHCGFQDTITSLMTLDIKTFYRAIPIQPPPPDRKVQGAHADNNNGFDYYLHNCGFSFFFSWRFILPIKDDSE